MPKIKFSLNTMEIEQAIAEVKRYRAKVIAAGDEIARQLADLGYEVAWKIIEGHQFTGDTAASLTVQRRGESQYVLFAQSQAILFFEFGAGVRYGYGHPMAGEMGFGPGTYPGNGHWDDPDGWWFETSDPRLIKKEGANGKTYGHSYGNRPHMPFYTADKAMQEALLTVARKVMK